MLTVSLHGIRLHAPYGLYPQEHILGNDFEVDVDIWVMATATQPWPFIDYATINNIVNDVFQQPGQIIETFVQSIHTSLKAFVPTAEKIKVAVRKLHPPLSGDVQYAQVCYEG